MCSLYGISLGDYRRLVWLISDSDGDWRKNMKWHFWSKTIYRRLAMFFSGIFGALLLVNANLAQAKGLHKYPEINSFLEQEFREEIILPYNIFFCGLILVGLALFVVSWKPYNNRRREGIWLNNIATGYLATVFLGYGITTLAVLKLFSYDVILAFIISAFLYVLFVKDIFHYTKNKRIFAEESNMKWVKVSGAIALVLSVVAIIIFSNMYKWIYDKSYQEYKEYYTKHSYSLLSEGNEKENYIRIKFVNYFNIDGVNITFDGFTESVNNIKDDSGSWYELWYCRNFLEEIKYTGLGDINFSSYGWEEKPDVAYLWYVKTQLSINGVSGLASASYEEIDEACQQVYEIYANQYPIEFMGDEAGEVVLNIDTADSNNIEDWSISNNDNRYYGSIGTCRETSNLGDTGYGNDSVTELKNGKMYALSLCAYLPLPYMSADEPQVTINGIDYKDIRISDGKDSIDITIWIIPKDGE